MFSHRQKLLKNSRLAAGALLGAGSVAVLRARDSFAAACGETQTYFDWGCKDASGKDTGINGLLWTAFQWLSAGVGIAVIGGIVYGAILYISSSGNAAQTKKGIGIVIHAGIALLLYGSMWAIVNWLVPGGAF